MDEMSAFEREFGSRLQRYALPARGDFDPVRIAHAAVGGRSSAHPGIAFRLGLGGPWALERRSMSAMVLLVLAVLIAMAVAILGTGSTRPPDRRLLYTDGFGLHVLDPDTGQNAVLSADAAPGAPFQVTWSPDRTRLAFVTQTGTDQTLWVADGDGRRARSLGPTSGIPYAWSADSARIAVSRWEQPQGSAEEILSVVEIDGTGSRRLGAAFWKDSGGPTWSPDGSEIALTARDAFHGVIVVDVATGTTHPLSQAGGQYGPHWAPDGSLIAYSTGIPGSLDTIRPDGTGHRILAAGGPYLISWSPDARSIAFATVNSGAPPSKVSIVDLATGTVRTIDLSGQVTGIHWSPDGDRLSYVTQAGDLWIVGRDGRGARRVATGVGDFDW
jgi:Tol biopolymer transport system component